MIKKFCIICNKSIYKIWDNLDFLNSATSFKIEPGYGSSFDGEILNFCICDNCLDIKKKNTANALCYYMPVNKASFIEKWFIFLKKLLNRK